MAFFKYLYFLQQLRFVFLQFVISRFMLKSGLFNYWWFCALQSGSTSRSASRRRSSMLASDSVVASAVRRLNLERDFADSDSMLAGPTTRLQWCQQWLHSESAKRRSSEPNTVRRGFFVCVFANSTNTFVRHKGR